MEKKSPDERLLARVHSAIDFREHLESAEARNRSVEVLRMARAVALAGLPKRKPAKGRTSIARTMRLGKDLWLRATYTSLSKSLPYGSDRYVLAAVQHLAIQQDSPLVTFKRVAEVLSMFELGEGGRNLKLLRERFHRLGNLAISLRFASSEDDLDQGEESEAENIFVIERYHLPTRKDLQAEKEGQKALPLKRTNDPLHGETYGVRIGDSFWRHLNENTNRLLMPLELLQLFTDRPTGWDYACFLLARCGAARTASQVPHEAIVSLFKDSGKESDRHVVRRLQGYHEEIMAATGDRLTAEWVEVEPLQSGGRGRPKKRWALKVGPSKSVLGRLA
jgi:hypothetical protein